MNFRNMTHDEVTPFLDHPVHGPSAHTEFCRRYLEGTISPTRTSADIEDQLTDVFENGVNAGQQSEREWVVDGICERLCFKYKDKIEADVIDKLTADIRNLFPPLGENLVS